MSKCPGIHCDGCGGGVKAFLITLLIAIGLVVFAVHGRVKTIENALEVALWITYGTIGFCIVGGIVAVIIARRRGRKMSVALQDAKVTRIIRQSQQVIPISNENSLRWDYVPTETHVPEKTRDNADYSKVRAHRGRPRDNGQGNSGGDNIPDRYSTD